MPIDPWLPVGFLFADGVKAKKAIREGAGWQIYELDSGGRALVADEKLSKIWVDRGLLDSGVFQNFSFGSLKISVIACGPEFAILPVLECSPPNNRGEAAAFAEAMRLTREIDAESDLQNAIYVEKHSRLLPTLEITDRVEDDIVLGNWLTGGVPISINSTRRFRTLTGWLPADHIDEIIKRSGVKHSKELDADNAVKETKKSNFSLAGRPALEHFLNEHVIDIVQNRERYKVMGIDFPSAIILHGPPGCGKTFAIEQLVEYLEWPSYQIEASSVASPYIHETSKKIAAVFDKAIENAPSIIVIDEMEAFLTDRQVSAGSGQHHIEEVAEFLRRIPEAIKSNVLIVAMTNRIEMIDPAILRRGRFDHVIKVDMASETEVCALLDKLLSKLPAEPDLSSADFGARLKGRPLSDVAFVVREAARLAARAGKEFVDKECLEMALKASPSREEVNAPRKIGFAT